VEGRSPQAQPAYNHLQLCSLSAPFLRPHQGLPASLQSRWRTQGKAAPANLHRDPGAEVWGVLYRITRRDLLRLDSTEGVPGRGYRHIEIAAEDRNGRVVQAVTYMAQGNEVDGKPSLRCITLLRDGARAHGLPETHIRFLESVEHVQ
jgi:gamma-glutamylcyclotransferase